MDDSSVVRVMPNSLEAEQSVIGSILIDPQAIMEIIGIINGQDFYHKLYGTIYDVMTAMSNEGQRIDIVTVFENLKKNSALADSISTDDLRNLVVGVPTSANIKQYAKIVHDKAVLRNIIRVNEEIANECYAGNMETYDILNKTEQKIFKLI